MSNSLGSFLLGGLMQPLLGTLQNWTSKKRKQREDEQTVLDAAVSGVAGGQSGRSLGSLPAGCVLRQGGRIIPADNLPARRDLGAGSRAKDGSGSGVLTEPKSLGPAPKRRRGSAGRGQGNAAGGGRRGGERNETVDRGLLDNGSLQSDQNQPHPWHAAAHNGELQRSKRGKVLKRKARNSARKAAGRGDVCQDTALQGHLDQDPEAALETPPQVSRSDAASENREATATGHDALSVHAVVSSTPAIENGDLQRKTAASFPESGHLSTSVAFPRQLGLPAGSPEMPAQPEMASGQARGNDAHSGLRMQEGLVRVDGGVISRNATSFSSHLSSVSEQVVQKRGAYLSSTSPSFLSSSSPLSLPSASCSAPRPTGDEERDERGLQRLQFSSLPSSLDPCAGEVGSRRAGPFSRLAQIPASSSASEIDRGLAEADSCFGGEAGDKGEEEVARFRAGGDKGADNNWPNSKLSHMFRPLSSLSAASSSTTASITTCASTRLVVSSSRSICCSTDPHQSVSSSSLCADVEQKEGMGVAKNAWGGFEEASGRGGVPLESRSFGRQLQHSEHKREQIFTATDSQEDREDNKENQILQDGQEDEPSGQEGKERSEVFGHRVLRPLRSKNLHENYDALIDIVAFAKRRCEKETMELLRRDVQILYYARGLHHPSHVKTFQRQAQQPLTTATTHAPPPPSSYSLPSVTAALAAGAQPHPCPSWATREELGAAMSRQDAFNPFTVFGEAPPELVLSEIYDQRHYTHVSAQTRASHPVIARLAASHGGGEVGLSRDNEEERRLQLQKRQIQEALRDRAARKEITPDEAKRLWLEALEDLQRKRGDRGVERGGSVSAAIHQELVKYGFARQLDVTIFREKLLPALEAWWKGQCDIELDWRHDPLTSEECAWYAEAMHALTDATEIMTVKQLCFCPTPPPYKPWSWTDSRFRLRQKTEARRKATELRQKNGRAGGEGRVQDTLEGETDVWEGAQTPQAGASELEGDERGRGGMSARKRSRSRGRRGVAGRRKSAEQRGKPQREDACLDSACTAGDADAPLQVDRGTGTGDNEKNSAFSEGSPITPQVRRGVGGQLVVITRRGALSQDQMSFPHADSEGQPGDSDAPRGRWAKRQKPNSPHSATRVAQIDATNAVTSAGNSATLGVSAESTSQLDSAFLGKNAGVIQSVAGLSGSSAPSWVATKNRIARAYHWNTPPSKNTGLRSALERRAAATAAAAAAAVASWTGNRPLVSPVNGNRISPGLFSGKTFCGTQWWPRSQTFKGMHTSPFMSTTGVSDNAKASGLPSSFGQEARPRGQDLAGAPAPGGRRSGGNGVAVSSIARPGQGLWTRVERVEEHGKRVYCRPLTTVPRARLSIDRVYGGRHNDFGRSPYTYWPTF
uniref:Inner centromere protein ARK-binding domain-containing protein n=1 Tax=Neospora caninum (strain Liverpool) TaxID=572307 RepID=F0JB54_NEOCL|nr:hypothetical protein, conserved [Neospora caninum Liverpool]CEL71321.1 TPA: hypothetical protein, conserved [Neospora caninum Liverpool]